MLNIIRVQFQTWYQQPNWETAENLEFWAVSKLHHPSLNLWTLWLRHCIVLEVLFIKHNLRYGILNLNFLRVQPFVSNFIMSMVSAKLHNVFFKFKILILKQFLHCPKRPAMPRHIKYKFHLNCLEHSICISLNI